MHYGQIVYFNYSKALYHQLEGDSSLPEEGWLALLVIWIIILLEPNTDITSEAHIYSYCLTTSKIGFWIRGKGFAMR